MKQGEVNGGDQVSGSPRSPHCDFCGRESPRVLRVALDEGYDRLGKRHAVRYACPDCSAEKEAARAAQVDGPPKPL